MVIIRKETYLYTLNLLSPPMKGVLFVFVALLTIRGYSQKRSRIFVRDKIPLLIETGGFIDRIAADDTLEILDNRLRLTLISKPGHITAGYYFPLHKPITREARVAIECSVSTDNTLRWFPVGTDDTVVFDQSMRMGQLLTLRFRKKPGGAIIQSFYLKRIYSVPVIVGYRAKPFRDTISAKVEAHGSYRNHKIVSLFTPIDKDTIRLPAGNTVEILLADREESADSIFSFRIRKHTDTSTPWKQSGHLISLDDIVSGNEYLVNIRYSGLTTYTALVVSVAPLWHQRAIIRIVLFLAVTSLLAGITLRIRHIRRRNHFRRRELAAAKLKGSDSLTNPHLIFNQLSSIRALIEKGDQQTAATLTEKLSGHIRQWLRQRDSRLNPLQDELEMIYRFVDMYQLQHRFRFVLDVDPSIDVANTEFPVMLLQPTLENAILHGIAGSQQASLHVHFQKASNNLEIRVTNPRNRAHTSLHKGHGIGVSSTQAKLDALQMLYPTCAFEYKIIQTEEATTAVLRFINWL